MIEIEISIEKFQGSLDKKHKKHFFVRSLKIQKVIFELL